MELKANSLYTNRNANELNSISLLNDSSLRAYYRLEGNSNDSKNSNNGSDTNMTYGSSYGKFGQGGSFGGNSKIVIPDNSTLNLGNNSFSISLWFKVSSVGGEYTMFEKRPWVVGSEDGWGIGLLNSTTIRIHSYTDNDFTVPNIADSAWHHVVFIHDRSTNYVKIYLDGAYIGQASNSGSNQSNTYSAYIGSSPGNTYFTGQLDDIALFAKALSVDEVRSLYGSGLKVYYRLESGALTTDESGNSKTLTNNSVTSDTGQFNGAGSFDKINSYLSIAEKLIVEKKQFSISLWVKSAGTQNTYACPFSQGHAGTNYKGFAFQFNYPVSNSLAFIYGDGGVWRGLDFAYNPNSDTNWHHLVVTRNGNSINIYKDGSLVTGSSSYAPDFDSSNTSIGQDTNNTDSNHRRWYGLIDDVAIFDRELSSTEISALYAAKAWTQTLNDTENLSDVIQKSSTKNLNDISILSDIFSRIAAFTKSLLDSFFSVSDDMDSVKGKGLEFNDTVQTQDIFSRTWNTIREFSDNIGISDIFSKIQEFFRSLTDTTTTSDSVITTAAKNKELNDSLSLIDRITKALNGNPIIRYLYNLKNTIFSNKYSNKNTVYKNKYDDKGTNY